MSLARETDGQGLGVREANATSGGAQRRWRCLVLRLQGWGRACHRHYLASTHEVFDTMFVKDGEYPACALRASSRKGTPLMRAARGFGGASFSDVPAVGRSDAWLAVLLHAVVATVEVRLGNPQVGCQR
jgi:hypothetical protein